MHRFPAALCLILAVAPLGAQGPTSVGLHAPAQAFRERTVTSTAVRDSVPASEWKKGAVIGAGVGAGIALLGIAACPNGCFGDTPHGPNVIAVIGSFALFAVLGGFIGSLFPKH